MTQVIDAVAPAEIPERPPVRSRRLPIGGRRVLAPFWKVFVLALCTAAAGFNAWWYWRETRPLPDIAATERLLRQGNAAAAETSLLERVRRSPHDGELRTLLARAVAARGDLLACARQLHQVPYWSSQKPDALHREGQAYLQLDRARDAERAWLELIKDDPLHPVAPDLLTDAYNALLRLYAIEDRWEDAYPVIWSAYDRASGTQERLYWLTMRMRAELERVSPKESIVELRRYVAADPGDCDALHALGLAEIALGQRAEGEAHLEECLKIRPDYLRAWRSLLAAFLEEGDLERFLAKLRVPPPSADNDPETWFNRGVAGEKAGDWRMAASHFQKAINLNPFLPKAYYRLRAAQDRLGLREAAIVSRKKSTVINEARGRFQGAYADFFESARSEQPPKITPAAAARRLAAICETLGWARAAQAWHRQADGPE
jgi:tetratricopeptide (TPR) repeat protein